jgi:hypothetical protein
MRLKLENITLVIEGRGFTRTYIEKLRVGLILYAKQFSKLLSEEMGVKLNLKLNADQFNQTITDTLEDLKRLTDFHPTPKVNVIKETAYIAYWWLQRRPLELHNEIKELAVEPEKKLKLTFLNQYFLAAYIEERIFDNDKAAKKVCNNIENMARFEAEWQQARGYIIYFLSYRANSPKSIEALLVASTLHPIRPTTADFWQDDLIMQDPCTEAL